jgi:hypothetical protein
MKIMKKVVFLSVVFSTLLFTSCKVDLNVGGHKIEPSSNIVKNEYKMSAFDQMDVDVMANVKFIQSSGDDYRVVLSCPDNYVELIGFEVEKDGELEINFLRNNVNIDAKNVDITVYAPNLRKLENGGVASVEIDHLKGDRIELENSGVGALYLSGLQFVDIAVECSGVGGIELAGTADRVRMECSGVGSIKAEQLKAKSVKAEVSGVGGITCYASEYIEGEVSGVGSLKYGGNPKKGKSLKRSGVGDCSEL